MIQLQKTDAAHLDFIKLVQLLNVDLAQRDGANHPLTQFNEIDTIKNVILAYENNTLLGCGAIKEYDTNYMEIKRLYVVPEHRGKGIANKIVDALENWAKEIGYTKFVLVMGLNQPEAQALYAKIGYTLTSDFGNLSEIKQSRCFIKEANPSGN